MSQENVEMARRVVEAFNRLDVAALTAIASADIEFETLTGNAVTTTVYHGHEGIRSYFDDLAATWAEITIEAEELRDLGDRGVLLLATVHAIGRASRVEVEMPFATLLEFCGVKIRRMQAFADHKLALDALGLTDG